MAIKLNSGSSGDSDEFSAESAIIADINVTPLVDIFLLLLVIFMVTSSFISTSNIPVQLPQAKSGTASEQQTSTVIVTLNSEGAVFVNTVAVAPEQLEDALKLALAKSIEKTVVLEGDRQAVLGTVVNLMDIAKRAGALKIAVATQSDGSSQSQ